MQPPKDVEVFENSTSYIWFDDEGNLCSTFKENYPPADVEDTKKNLAALKELLQGEKRNFILDIDKAQPSGKKSRDYTADELPKYVNAFALVGTKPMTRMLVNLFFGLKKPPYPSKIFATEEEARKWLRQYPLDNEGL